MQRNLDGRIKMMRCPKCGGKLVQGPSLEFETLAEHIWDPNKEEYPPRPTFWCKNGYCKTKGKGFFSGYGEYYPCSTVKIEKLGINEIIK